MQLDLEGKVAIVTGGSKGIVRGSVETFLREGASVLACARGQEALDQRVGAQQRAAAELDLVVAHVAERPEGLVEIQQVVAAFLEHDHRPAGLAQHLGHRRPGRAGPDDDRVGVEVAHRSAPAGFAPAGSAPAGFVTWSSVQPRGWTSPSKPMAAQPPRSRLPP